MKTKIFITLLTIFTITSIFAFPFRTSCGKVYEITGTANMTNSQLANFLFDVNFAACPQDKSKVVTLTIYEH